MQDTGRFVSELNNALPSNQDPRAEGAGQIRNIKTALQNTFPHLRDTYAVDTRPFTPLGAVMMYSGTKENLTAGWEMCDSERTVNGVLVPDLRGKFIMGATTDEVTGRTGGKSKFDKKSDGSFELSTQNHTLTEAQMPAHQHYTLHNSNAPSRTRVNGNVTAAAGGEWGGNTDYFIAPADNNPNPNSARTSTTGGNQAHSHGMVFDNRPEYYTLAYIIFVGLTV